MPNNLILHHSAKRITPGSLELIMDLFKQLGCRESYWETGARWAMIEGNNSIIQFIETDQMPQKTDEKRNSHLAFLSRDPLKNIHEIQQWLDKKNIKTVTGQWSDKELYIDCPDLFVDFVIEIMHMSVVE